MRRRFLLAASMACIVPSIGASGSVVRRQYLDSLFECANDVCDLETEFQRVTADQNKRIVRLGYKKHYVINQPVKIPSNTEVDLNQSTLIFELSGASENLIVSSGCVVYNGIICSFGSDHKGHGGYQCPLVLGDYLSGDGVSNVVIHDVEIRSNRPNGNGVLVTGDANNIELSNLRFPDSSLLGRPILVHWGGADLSLSKHTTHPRNIAINNIKMGRMSAKYADSSGVFISAATDVKISNIFAEYISYPAGLVQCFAGDLGNFYSAQDTQESVMSNISIENITAASFEDKIIVVDNRSKNAPVNMILPGPRISGVSGNALGKSAYAVDIRSCRGGSLIGNKISPRHFAGVKLGMDVIDFEVST